MSPWLVIAYGIAFLLVCLGLAVLYTTAAEQARKTRTNDNANIAAMRKANTN